MSARLAFCESRREWILELTARLARLESPTTDKAAADRCGAEIAAIAEGLGGRVARLRRAEVADHLRAEFGGGERQLLLLGHFDTVWPVGQLARMPVALQGDRLHGPGVYDMKAGIALGLLAIEAALAIDPPRDRRLVLLLTSDEETGSATSREVIEAEARRSEAVFVLEPALAGGGVKTRRKGVGVFELVVHGVAAHAGVDPGRGSSAIHELARQIVALSALPEFDRGISVNVGRVSGGTRSNVVAERAEAEIDVRVDTMADAERVERVFRSLKAVTPGTRVEVSGGINRPPMERTPGVAALYEAAREIAAGMGFALAEGGTGGASDGNFTAALGVPTLDGLGAVGDGAHALHEHVIVGELPRRAALLAELLATLDLDALGGAAARPPAERESPAAQADPS
jgi:glutamate carboxypeptidase